MAKAETYLVEAHASHVARQKSEQVSALAEKHFTTNLFLLAQVYQHLGKPDLSAAFCQQTLDRQVIDNACNNDEWMKNATQLSGYYLGQVPPNAHPTPMRETLSRIPPRYAHCEEPNAFRRRMA
eukprot:2618246-Rhodomonas_salina.3